MRPFQSKFAVFIFVCVTDVTECLFDGSAVMCFPFVRIYIALEPPQAQ